MASSFPRAEISNNARVIRIDSDGTTDLVVVSPVESLKNLNLLEEVMSREMAKTPDVIGEVEIGQVGEAAFEFGHV